MIIDYIDKYREQVIELFCELQEYIVHLDKEKYNILSDEYGALTLNKTLDEVKKYQGKFLLYVENDNVLGLIVGLINNNPIDDYDFKCPKRGRISELIVKKGARAKGIGSKLMASMEKFLYDCGCKSNLIGVFGYNDLAINFYNKCGYHTRMIEMIKVD